MTITKTQNLVNMLKEELYKLENGGTPNNVFTELGMEGPSRESEIERVKKELATEIELQNSL